MKQSQKLSYLLRLLWNSPIFGDAFPTDVYEAAPLRQMKEIYECFHKKIRPILAEGMPHSSISEINEVIHQIAPKSVAFCAAISAGEIEDAERLCDVAAAIAISYWADQSMDRGDEAMLAAVRHINARIWGNAEQTQPGSNLVAARLSALRHIETLARQANESPDDLPFMLRAIYRDVLFNQARVRDLSRMFLTEGGSESFWKRHAADIAQTLLANSGLMSAVTVIYAIYRRNRPEIPSLADIYEDSQLMELVGGPFNGAIRVFDDLGDRLIDMGQDAQWGIFNINLFNQPHAKLLEFFIAYSGVEDDAWRNELLFAFAQSDSASRLYVAKSYVALLRSRFENLPRHLWERYALFLSLCKRTLEAGLVNSVGDILLSEGQGTQMAEMDILNLITSGAS